MTHPSGMYSTKNQQETPSLANAHGDGTNFLRSDSSVGFAEDVEALEEEASHPDQDW